MSSNSNERPTSSLLPLALIIFLLVQMVFTVLLWRDVRALHRDLELFVGYIGEAEVATGSACPGLEVGFDAPPLMLRDTEGQEISLIDYKGYYVLLVFSSTQCSYCAELYDDLRLYDQEFRTEDTVMLLVSRATEEENRALKQDKGFDFPVLTATTDIFRSFSIPGTPMLVLVDKQGMTRGCGGANQIEQIVQFVNTHTQ